MAIKLNSFSNKSIRSDHAIDCADTLASIVNDILEAQKEMEAVQFEDSKCQKISDDVFWIIYNRISYLETDLNNHPHLEAQRQKYGKTI